MVFQEKNLLMIGNSRWHWASQINGEWKYFHTCPNPIEYKNKDYSQIIWASVGPVPNEIELNSEKKINLNDIPLINLPSNLGIDRALASWSVFKNESKSNNKENGFLIVDAGTILSITKITDKE